MSQTWSLDGVRQERFGWRDEAISQRHRLWGFNCPAIDIDFLMIEYSQGKPVALIEYKHHLAFEPSPTSPSMRAIAELAGIHPFLIAFYWPDIWQFRVKPMNFPASIYFLDNEVFTEREFVARLYEMRGLELGD